MAEKDTSNRGFGSMDDERQREIAREGGHAAQEKGTVHKLTPDEARKGGEAVSSDRGHMSEIGRKGGENSQDGESMEEDEEDNETVSEDGLQRRSMRGGTPEQHAEAGRQSHKNDEQSEERNQDRSQKGSSQNRESDLRDGEKTRGGSSEQHVEAGRQSHKNR
jgi:general stress protein YciG